MKNLKTKKTKELSLEELDDVSGGVTGSNPKNVTVKDGESLTLRGDKDNSVKMGELIAEEGSTIKFE